MHCTGAFFGLVSPTVASSQRQQRRRRIPFRGFLELVETGAKKPGVGATLPTEKPGEREDGEREEEERRARDGEREGH